MSAYTDTYEEQEEELEQGSMSFLEHLDELRKRLVRCAIFIFVVFIVCWFFSDRIYGFLQVPVQAALFKAHLIAAGDFSKNLAVKKLDDMPDGQEIDVTLKSNYKVGQAVIQAGTTIPAKVVRAEDGSAQIVLLRPWLIDDRTILDEGTVIPREVYLQSSLTNSPETRLVTPTVQGGFNLFIKVSFYSAIFFSVPFLLIQVWGFISPGLYKKERRYALPFILMGSLFFLGGCAFAYYIAFPRAADFLLSLSAEGNLRPLVSAEEYFDLILTIMLGLGVIFEMPTLTFFLARLGILSPQFLMKGWRYSMLIIFIIAALISPTTDIPNMLVFATPMILLYALSIGIAWFFYRKRKAREAA
ncbi:MAG: twin-arginine translocase subunit TatC [Acidobacteriota bacterium]